MDGKNVVNNTDNSILAEDAAGNYEAQTIQPGQSVLVNCNGGSGIKVTSIPPLPQTVVTESDQITVTQAEGALVLTPFEA